MTATMLGLPMLAAIAVTIDLPSDADDEAEARVVDSCQAVLGPDQCTLAPSGGDADWHAVVHWQGVRLLVTVKGASNTRTHVARREVVFSPSDSESERWFAAGLMVAALAAAQSELIARPEPTDSRAREPGTTETSTRNQENQTSEPHRRRATVQGLVDVGGLVGRGLTSSDPKFGGILRGWLLFNRPPLGATASLQFAGSPGDPRARWYGGAAGLAASVLNRASAFELLLRGEFLFEQVGIRAIRQGIEERATSSWRGGGQLGLVGSYRLTRWFAPWIAADISALRPEIELRIADQTVGNDGNLRWAFSVGGRFLLIGEPE